MLLPSHPFKEISSNEQIYQGKRFSVFKADILSKSGQEVTKEAIIHPGAVVILPIVDNEHIVMIRNYRIVIGQELWELPAGTLEPNESPDKTAYRELIEETGYESSQIQFLSSFYTSPGICDELMYAFVAENLKHVGQQLEETEEIKVEIISWDQVWKKVREGSIKDGKTLAALLLYNHR